MIYLCNLLNHWFSNYLLKDTVKEVDKVPLSPIAYEKSTYTQPEVSLFIQKLKQEHTKITGVDNFYFTFKSLFVMI